RNSLVRIAGFSLLLSAACAADETAPPMSSVRVPPPSASGTAGTGSTVVTAGSTAKPPTTPITNPTPTTPQIPPPSGPAPTTPQNPMAGTGALPPTKPMTPTTPTTPMTPATPPPMTSGKEPRMPNKLAEPCPMLQTGMVKIAGTDVQLWVGNKV